MAIDADLSLDSMKVVLVAGAAGGLGHRTAVALAHLGNTQVRGLVRTLSPSDNKKAKALDELKAAGVELVEGELNKPETLGRAVAGVDVIVSCVMGDEKTMVEGQTNLLTAAKAAGARKFVASTFSMNLFAVDPQQYPNVAARRRFADILQDSGMPHLHINIGSFLEVFWGFLGLYNPATGVLQYYGSPDQKIDVTTYQDTAEFTARAAVDDGATGVLEFAGDQISMNEVAAVYKEVTGSELPLKCMGSLEDLDAEKERRMRADPAAWMMYMPLLYQRVMFDGTAKLHHIANSRYPEVHPLDMRAFLQQHPDVNAAAWWPGVKLPSEFYHSGLVHQHASGH